MAEETSDLEKDNRDRRTILMIAKLPYPAVFPPYALTVLDSELNLWFEEFRATTSEPSDWSVFDGMGIWLGRVTLPVGLEVYEIGSDCILGRSVDDVGVERIEVYALVKN